MANNVNSHSSSGNVAGRFRVDPYAPSGVPYAIETDVFN